MFNILNNHHLIIKWSVNLLMGNTDGLGQYNTHGGTSATSARSNDGTDFIGEYGMKRVALVTRPGKPLGARCP